MVISKLCKQIAYVVIFCHATTDANGDAHSSRKLMPIPTVELPSRTAPSKTITASCSAASVERFHEPHAPSNFAFGQKKTVVACQPNLSISQRYRFAVTELRLMVDRWTVLRSTKREKRFQEVVQLLGVGARVVELHEFS